MGTKRVPGANTPYSDFEGLIAWDARFDGDDNLGTGSIVYAGGEPDQPVAQTDSFASLEATGTADGIVSSNYYVETIRAGLPLPGGSTAARMTWSTDGTSATRRGHLPYKVMTGFEYLKFDPAGAVGFGYSAPHAITLASGKVLLVYVDDVNDVIKTYRRSTAGTWSDTGNVVSSAAALLPKLVQLPGGRVLCIVQGTTSYSGATYAVVTTYHSDDEGSTWTAAAEESPGILLNTASYTAIPNASVCYHNGYLTYVVTALNTAIYRLLHYYSFDLGASWTLVEEYSSADTKNHTLVATDAGDVLLIFVKTNDHNMYIARKTTPSARFQDDPRWLVASTYVTGGGILSQGYNASTYSTLAACLDQDHTLHVIGRRNYYLSVGQIDSRISLNRFDAATIERLYTKWGDESTTVEPIDLGDPNDVLVNPAALVPAGGSLLMIGYAEAAVAPGPSIYACILGGYSDVDWNGPTFGRYSDTVRYGAVYFPIVYPSTLAIWTNAGAGTENITSSGLDLDFSGGAAYRTYTRAGGAARPCIAWVQHRQVSGGDITTENSCVRLRYANGTLDYDVQLRFGDTSARLVDLNNASATIGTDITGLTADTMYDFLVFLTGSRAAVYYKLPSATRWTAGPAGTATNDGATPGASNLFVWGCGALLATTTQRSIWGMVGSCIDDFISTMSVAEPNNARPVFGREVSIWPVFVSDGTRVAARGGPLYKGDSWLISTHYQYGPDKLDLSRYGSPWAEVRTTNDSAEHTIQWDFTNATDFGTTAAGIGLLRPNFRTAYFEYWDGAAWQAICTIDCTSGLSGLTFDRTGDIVYPKSGTASGTRYVAQDELSGEDADHAMGYCYMDDGGGTIAVRPILAHPAGVWVYSGSRSLSFRIGGSMTGVPTSGTLHVIFPAVAVVKFQHTARATKFRVRVAAQDTYENYFRIKPLVGGFFPFGLPSSNGATESLDPLQDVTDLDNGTRLVRRRAPPRRTKNLVWSDAIPARDVFASSLSPDYVAAASGASYAGLALYKDPGVTEGAVRGARGAQRPVIYCPRVVLGSDTVTLTGRELLLYGRIKDGTQRTEVRRTAGRIDVTTMLDIEEEL